ncbi:MAG: hypothetical protein H7Z41_11620 [Cytophagales bacterium]|nr:hypothetical protein [Armatimonadota bacterium]
MSNTSYNNDRTTLSDDELNDDSVQHGIDDNPSGDAEKGAALGGVGGAVTGAIAGSAVGPLGTLAGAVIGGLAGAVASGAAVAAVDRVDNDNTVSGVGHGATTDVEDTTYVDTPGNRVPGIQTGGYTAAGTPDTRGISEKAADAVTGDRMDDKTGLPVAGAYGTGMTTPAGSLGTAGTYGVAGSLGATGATAYDTDPDSTKGLNQREELGETTPSIKTGGYANDGTPDTRGVGEKVVDAVTGDPLDDKTGKVVNHP